MKKKYYIFIILAALFIVGSASYTSWNRMNLSCTCAQCHEVRPACMTWEKSVQVDDK